MINKLQFIHQNTVFADREAAKAYLKELIINTRPSLYAEPLVVKYESGDDAKGPNILLAIGSVGDGNYDVEYNRTQQRLFFIDIAYCEEEIEAIWERIEEIVKMLTVIPLESDTISLHTSVTSEGTEISGDVRVADAQVIHGVSRPNQINVVHDDGLYHFVDVSYSDNGVLTFQVNDEVKDMSIPVLTGGTYHYDDEDAENLVLSMSNGETIKVNLRKLIDEWTVLPINAITTPIVLKKEKINPEHLPYGVSEWQDVLTADIRLHEGDGNILYKNDSGRTLYATVNLEYNEIENKLVFTWSENGQVNTKDIALNSVKLIEYIRYDAVKEEIVIGYKTAISSETIEVRIPVGDLITEWIPVSEAHNVILNRTRNISGTDEVTADVRIASREIVPTNIVETIGENKAIFVRGEADNIKYKDSDVHTELERLDSEDERIEAKFDDKTAFLSGTCDTINNTIGTGFTDDPHSNITAKFAEISGYTSGIEEDLQAEIDRAEAAENFISGSVDVVSGAVDFVSGAVVTVDNKVGTGFTEDPHSNVTAQFNALSAYTSGLNNALSDEIERAKAAEDFISGAVDYVSGAVDTTNENLANEINRSTTRDEQLKADIDFVSAATDTKLSGITCVSGITVDESNPTNPKIYLELDQNGDNILTLSREGLYTTVDLTYNESDNKLTFSTAKGSKDIELNSVKFIEYIRYDAATEEIVIGYKTAASGEIIEVRIPVGDIITEWIPVSNGHNVILNRSRNVSGTDEVTADVRIASTEVLPSNILETVDSDKSLYVRGEADNIKFGNTNVKVELERLDSEDIRIESKFDDETAFLSGTCDTTNATIGNGFSTDAHNTITYKFAEISGYTSGVEEDLQAEINRAEAAEDFISGAVNVVSDAVDFVSGAVDTVDNKIGTGFTDDPHSNVTAQFDALSAYTSGVNNALSGEVERATAAEGFISGAVDSVSGAVTFVSGAVDTVDNKIGTGFTDDPHTNVTAQFEALSGYTSGLNTNLNGEIERAEAAEDFISGAVDSVSGSVDFVSGVVTTINNTIGSGFTNDPHSNVTAQFEALSAYTSGLNSNLNGEIERAEAAENVLNDKVTFVSGAVDTTNTNLNNEISRSTTRDEELTRYIDSVSGLAQTKVSGVTAGNSGILIDNTTPTNPKVNSNISHLSNNIVRLSEGIFASADLTYNETTNTLTFHTTNGSKDINLVSNSIVDRVYYDASRESIIIEYRVNGQRMPDVVVPVHDLIREWDVQNHDGNTVTLTKTIASGSGVDLLSARVNVSTNSDNLLEVVDNEYLTVSRAPITAVENRVTALETHSGDTDAFIDRVVEGVGLKYDGTYEPNPNTQYVSSATSVQDALTKLDSAVVAAVQPVDVGDGGLYIVTGSTLDIDFKDAAKYDAGDPLIPTDTNVKFTVVRYLHGGLIYKYILADVDDIDCGDYA